MIQQACRQCGKANEGASKYCAKCGSPLVSRRINSRMFLIGGLIAVLIIAVGFMSTTKSTPQGPTSKVNLSQLQETATKARQAILMKSASAQEIMQKLISYGACKSVINSYAYNREAPALFKSDELRICSGTGMDTPLTYMILTGNWARKNINGHSWNDFEGSDPRFGSDHQGVSIGDGACGNDYNNAKYDIKVCDANGDMDNIGLGLDYVHTALND